jgi:uncharacterized LabA/DUF88 family protein
MVKRVCIFVDGSNLYFALKRNNRPTRVDYYELGRALAGPNRDLMRIFYYNAIWDPVANPDKAKTQQTFLDSLDRTPYLELRLGKIVQRDNQRMEKGVDVRLASDMVFYAAKDFYDVAIVVTEDQDFVSAMALVKELGKHVELATFSDGQNRDMMRVADWLIPLADVTTKHKDAIFPPDGAASGNYEHPQA